jgi:hypothetical protein
MHSQTENHPTQTRLIPLTDWALYHPWPPIGGLRDLVFRSKVDANGFDKVIRRVGRRVLLDEQAFFVWCDQQNADSAANLRRGTAR